MISVYLCQSFVNWKECLSVFLCAGRAFNSQCPCSAGMKAPGAESSPGSLSYIVASCSWQKDGLYLQEFNCITLFYNSLNLNFPTCCSEAAQLVYTFSVCTEDLHISPRFQGAAALTYLHHSNGLLHNTSGLWVNGGFTVPQQGFSG